MSRFTVLSFLGLALALSTAWDSATAFACGRCGRVRTIACRPPVALPADPCACAATPLRGSAVCCLPYAGYWTPIPWSCVNSSAAHPTVPAGGGAEPTPTPADDRVSAYHVVAILDNSNPALRLSTSTTRVIFEGLVRGIEQLVPVRTRKVFLTGAAGDAATEQGGVAPADIVAYLSALSVEPTEGVLVWVQTEGDVAALGGHCFLINGERLYRSELERMLDSRQARFSLLLSDAYRWVDLGSPGPSARWSANDGLAGGQWSKELLSALFVQQRGRVSVVSCKIGEERPWWFFEPAARLGSGGALFYPSVFAQAFSQSLNAQSVSAFDADGDGLIDWAGEVLPILRQQGERAFEEGKVFLTSDPRYLRWRLDHPDIYRLLSVQAAQTITAAGELGQFVPSEGSQVHALLVVDATEPDFQTANEKIRRLLSRTMAAQPERLRMRELAATALTRDAVKGAIEAMDVAAADAVIVYCTVHGRRAGPSTQLLDFGSQTGEIDRDDLLTWIKQKEPRLSVLVTDSCFAGTTGGFDPVEGVVPRSAQRSQRVNVLASLLLNHKGVVNINSCDENEYAWGQFFADAFVSACRGATEVQDWGQFFTTVQTTTNSTYREFHERVKDLATTDPRLRAQEEQKPIAFELAERDAAITSQIPALALETPPMPAEESPSVGVLEDSGLFDDLFGYPEEPAPPEPPVPSGNDLDDLFGPPVEPSPAPAPQPFADPFARRLRQPTPRPAPSRLVSRSRSVLKPEHTVRSLATSRILAMPKETLHDTSVGREIVGMGMHAYFSGQDSSAKKAFDMAIGVDARNPVPYYFRGLILLRSGDEQSAEVDFSVGSYLESTNRVQRGAVGRALERIQGTVRQRIEVHRRRPLALPQEDAPPIIDSRIAASQ